MRKARLIVWICALALLGAVTARAQKPPQVELGFKADGLYQFSNLDSVNMFNGNLIVQIPIGAAYGVDGGFKYGLTLVYNSKVWDYDQTPYHDGRTFRTAHPNWRSNAGVGWRLSMGRLIGPTSATTNGWRWTYEDPSGSEHVFVESYENNPATSGVLYSVDQNRLRLVIPAADTPGEYPNTVLTPNKYKKEQLRRVEFPNGDVHTFAIDCEAWHLREMKDAFGNYVRVVPQCDANRRDVAWDLTDSVGRRHSVTFRHFQTTEHSIDGGQHVSDIALSTVAGTLHYTFDYEENAAVDWGCGHAPLEAMGIPARATLPLLERIILPDGTAFALQYYRTSAEGGFCAQGALRSLTVPLGGTFEYTYQQMRLPEDFCYLPQFPSWNGGVRTRKTPDGQWDYLATLSKAVKLPDDFSKDAFCSAFWDNREPNEMRTPGVDPIRRWARMSVLAPPALSGSGSVKTRQRTDSFFYAWTDAATPVEDDFNTEEHPTTLAKQVRFGQAITTGTPPGPALGPLPPAALPYATEADVDGRVGVAATPQASDIHYLSTRVYEGCADETASGMTVTGTCVNGRLLRSMYQRLPFAEERAGSPQWTYPAESSRTIHHDDATCGGQCWIQTSASDPDGYGKYKTSIASSNFSGSPKVEFTASTNYLGHAAGKPWLLNLYDRTTRVENGQKIVTDYSFNRSTGFLEAVRTRLDPDALAANDVLNLFSATSNGNVEREETYGGDPCDSAGNCAAGLPVNAPFSKGNAPRQYLTKHTFSRGVLGKSNVCSPASTADPCTSILTTVDLDIHHSGMPTASRDAAGVTTSYEYDEYGRLETVTAPGPTLTKYIYNAPTAASNATVRETVTDDKSVQLSETIYEFDPQGRVLKITGTLPDQKTATTTTSYDGLGRKWTVTQPRAAGESEFTTETRYDGLGRPVWVKAPDGKVTTFQYVGERTVERTASLATTDSGEASVIVTEHYDAQRRLSKVEEYSGGTSVQQPKGSLTATAYKYDVAGRLIEAKTGTQPARTFTYDRRGFLTGESHPESGSTTYTHHDSRGHARRRTSGTAVTLQYDAAERLTHVLNGTTVLKRFDFATANDPNDATNLAAGKLVTSVRRNEVSAGVLEVTETYHYAHIAGQLSKRVTQVEKLVQDAGQSITRQAVQTFEQKIDAYDAFRLPKTMSMPTCSLHGCSTTSGLGSVTFDRDAGFLETVRGFATLSYATSGMIKSVTHRLTPETTETDTYDPDSGMARPSLIKLGGAACPLPTAAIQSAGTICPGTGGTASVTAVAGTSYAWTIQGGSLTSPGTGTTVTFNAMTGTSNVTLSVTASNACGMASQTKAIAASTALASPVITAPEAVCANGTVTASVPANPGLTYVWKISSGSWSATGPTVTFTAPDTAFTLTVTATSSCGGTASASRAIGIAAPESARLYHNNPNLPYEPEVFRVRGSGETVTLKVVFPDTTGPWEISWSDGLRETATRNPHERIVVPETNEEYRLNAVTPQRCGDPTGIIYVRVIPPAPASVLATTQPDGKVYLTWSAVAGVDWYSIERKSTTAGALAAVAVAGGDATSLLYTPPATSGPQVHFYYVRAVDADDPDKSRAETFDHAITGTLPVAGTFMDSLDIQRLRAGIDAYRVAFNLTAAYAGVGAPEGVVAAADISDLVVKLNLARSSNPFVYRDVPPPAPNGFFYREHLQQLWETLR